MQIWPNILAWIAGAEASLVMIPQIRLMHKLRNSTGISHGMLFIRQFSFSCLVLYVFLTKEWTLTISYSFSLFINAYAWYLKFKFSPKEDVTFRQHCVTRDI